MEPELVPPPDLDPDETDPEDLLLELEPEDLPELTELLPLDLLLTDDPDDRLLEELYPEELLLL